MKTAPSSADHTALRDTLLPELMRGEVRVKNTMHSI